MLPSYGQERLERVRALVAGQSPACITVRVTSGMQQGSEVELATRAFRIGDRISDELFLLPRSEALGAVDISVGRLANVVFLSATTERKDVTLDGRPVTSLRLTKRLPCNLRIGADVVSISRVSERSDHGSETSLLAVALVSYVVLLALFAEWISFSPFPEKPTLQLSETEPNALERFQEAQQQAETVLIEAGLGNDITITGKQNSIVEVTGAISQSKLRTWQQARGEIEIVMAGLPVNFHVQPKQVLGNLPAIGLVVQAPQKFVVLLDGQKRTVGDVFVGDWKLADVHDHSLILQNADELIEVTYGDGRDEDQ